MQAMAKVTFGNGSIASPIVISDDEQDASTVVPNMEYRFTPVPPRPKHSNFESTTTSWQKPPKQTHIDQSMSYAPAGDVTPEPMPTMLKRKRDESSLYDGDGEDNDTARTPRTVYDSAFVPIPIPNKLGKKARKKRRKLERAAMEQAQQGQQPWCHNNNVQYPPSYPPASWMPPMPDQRMQMIHALPPNSNATLPVFQPDYQAGNAPFPAVGLPPRPPIFSQPLPEPHPPSLSILALPLSFNPPKAPKFNNTSPTSLPSRPTQPNKLLPIGMPPDSDPHSSHGIFRTRPGGPSYVPNPARSLVLENIPKKHKRLRPFLISWCKSLCRVRPVHLELDGKGKALIEFPSAEVARTAFAAPRFPGGQGKEYIRAWWYRVDGMGAGAGVGEIEEGEIEDDYDDDVTLKLLKMSSAARLAWAQKMHMTEARGGDTAQEVQKTSGLKTPPRSTWKPRREEGIASPSPVKPPTKNTKVASQYGTTSERPLIGSPSIAQKAPALRGHTPVDYYLPGTPSPPADHTQSVNMGVSKSPRSECDDHESIASSRAGSPRINHEVPPKSDDPDDAVSEDMDVASSDFLQPVDDAQSSVSLGDDNGEDANLVPTSGFSRDVQAPVVDARPHSHLRSRSHSLSYVSKSETPASTPTPPPDAPSAPRAMMNPPTAPSFTKRLLLARQKELQERIARSKLELSKVTTTRSSPNTTPTSTPAPDPASGSFRLEVDKDSNKVSVEDNLRRLVLDSKRNRAGKVSSLNVDASAESDSEATTASLLGSCSTSSFSRESSSPIPPPAVVDHPVGSCVQDQDALADLAVSFITEAIQTVKPLNANPPASLVKLELAAKQQKLEQQIAESKLLMAKLNTAQSKQEKDAILRAMRERSRIMEADMKQQQQLSAMYNREMTTTSVFSRLRWPETQHAGVLIVSDDEDEV